VDDDRIDDRLLLEGPFMFKTCDLCVNRSVNATVKTESWKIPCHFKNDKLLVIMVGFLSSIGVSEESYDIRTL